MTDVPNLYCSHPYLFPSAVIANTSSVTVNVPSRNKAAVRAPGPRQIFGFWSKSIGMFDRIGSSVGPPGRFRPASFTREIAEPFRTRAYSIHCDQLGRLRDMLQASLLMASYNEGHLGGAIPGRYAKTGCRDPGIEIIGEATAHLSDETRREISALPFRKMRGMRNIVSHDYANVDLGIVWQVATVHIPEVYFALETFFSKEEPSSPSAP
jgi:hypothetical protein